MTYEDWFLEEQEEVKIFFRINELELDFWPKAGSAASNDNLTNKDAAGNDDSDGEGGVAGTSGDFSITSGSLSTLKALSKSSFAADEGMLAMTGSMAGAKDLLEEVKDPLGINDSLYQMQVQRILLDPKYNQPSLGDSSLQPPTILLSAPNFDARLCLRLVHQFTSYEDLVRACDHLESGLAMRKDILKLLVRENFDRFVNAKNSIDSVYADIRAKGMNSGDYGMRPTTASINGALEKAQQVYHPLLKRRSREECIRKRLSVFQEYKAIFNLPAALHQHIKLGEFQQCVQAYRKGKELLYSEPAYSTLRPILEQVWSLQVEKAARGLRTHLFEKLTNPVFPFDVQIKIIGYLLELEATPDPLVYYFSTKSSLVLRHFQGFQDETIRAVEVNLAQPKASQLEDHVASLLKDTLRVLDSRVYEGFSELSYPAVREWKIVCEAFDNLAEHLKQTLQPMAKIASQINPTVDSRRTIALPLKEIYPQKLEEAIKMICESLQISVDSIFASISGHPDHIDNSAVGMFFTLRIVRRLGETFAAILDASPHPIMASALKTTLSHIIGSLLTRIWSAAVVDSRNLGIIEDWKLNSSASSTALVNSFENLSVFLLTATTLCRKIFFEVIQESNSSLDPFNNLEQWFSKSFNEFVVEGMYKYVQSVQSDKSDDGNSNCNKNDPNDLSNNNNNNNNNNNTNNLSGDMGILDEIGRGDSLNLLRLNQPARLLVVLANVSYLQREGLKNLLQSADLTDFELTDIFVSLGKVEQAVMQLFLQGQVNKIVEPVIGGEWIRSAGLHDGGGDRLSLSPPIYRALLAFSDVRALICDVSPQDPSPLLRDLANSLVSALLRALKDDSDKLNPRSALQARLDSQFVRKKLADSGLLSPESVQLFETVDALLTSDQILEMQIENPNSAAANFDYVWREFESTWTGPFLNLFSF